MNTVLSVFLSFVVIVLGITKVNEYKKSASAVDEVCRFVFFVKNSIRFKNSTYETILSDAEKENYRFIEISENKALLNKSAGEGVLNEYKSFLSKLGTGDTESQLNLCDEYSERFDLIRKKTFDGLPSKIKVCTSLSVLGALCILILGG